MKTDIGIHFIIAIFIWLVSWTSAVDIPYEYLSNPNKICLAQSSCAGVDAATAAKSAVLARADNDRTGAHRNCQCDERCSAYGDCCTDSEHFDPVAHQKTATRLGCMRVYNNGTDGGSGFGHGAYVTVKCADDWPDRRTRDACEASAAVLQDDGMSGNPVTSRSTGRAYRNRYCAVCNSDAADPVVWDTRLVCENLTDVAAGEEQAVLDTLRYDDDDGDGRWTVTYENVTYECDRAVEPPASLGARPCLPDAVVACHPKWPQDEIRSNCEAYTTIMYNIDRPYKNIHCAMCNHVPVHNLLCNATTVNDDTGVDTRVFGSQFSVRSFTALFIAQPGHRECLADHMFYDPLGKTCRPLVPTVGPLKCTAVAMYPAAAGWRPSVGDSIAFVTLDNGTVAVCADDRTPAAAQAFGSAVLTYVGLGASAVFLCVHLAVFAALPEMKNLSGKNLASFCVSLVCSYATFVAGNWLTGPACYAGAAATYYAFLTSFAWMLIMSFDCWRSLRLATVELLVTKGRQTKKFLVYSAVCWLVPAMLTFVAVAADAVPAVPDKLRPRFGADQCWFGSKTALLVFFAGPLSAVMAVNVALFAWTAHMIHSSRATVRHINTRHVRRDFRMYCRLAVLMGLTWITGIAASYADNKYLWILFVALNTFQGLFVFVAFTCRRRILNSLVGRGRGRDHDHDGVGKNNSDKSPRAPPPSFSWSSSDNSVPVSSEKTTDTLY